MQALADQTVEAKNIVQAVQSRGQGFSPYDMAAIRVALQDHPCALEWLEKAIEQRSIDTEWIQVDPRMDTAFEASGTSANY